MEDGWLPWAAIIAERVSSARSEDPDPLDIEKLFVTIDLQGANLRALEQVVQ